MAGNNGRYIWRGVGYGAWGEARCVVGVEQDQRFGRRGALAVPCHVWSHVITLSMILNVYSIKMICTK